VKAAILEFLLGQLHDSGVCLLVVVNVDVTSFINGFFFSALAILHVR
jgi:hypothetical protein